VSSTPSSLHLLVVIVTNVHVNFFGVKQEKSSRRNLEGSYTPKKGQTTIKDGRHTD
jgi:hypothetical protein